MKIKGVHDLSLQQVQDEVRQGATFVLYTYCISIIFLTFRRPSDIYFVKHNQRRVAKGFKYTLVSVLLGWWGFPWGIIYTIQAIGRNTSGGKDVTTEVMSALYRQNNGPAFDFENEIPEDEEKRLQALSEQR